MTDTVFTETMAIPPPEPPRPPAAGPGDWARRNLFRSPIDVVVTLVSGAVVGYVLYRLARYVFVTGRWDIVRVNLRLFLVGRYPVDELWRISLALVVTAFMGGLVAGYVARRRVLTGRGDPVVPRPWWRRGLDLILRLWPLIVGVVLLLLLSSTIGPWLTVLGMIVAAAVGRVLGGRLPVRSTLWFVAAVVAVAAVLVWFLSVPLPWDEWSGLMLNLFLAAAAITLCFPFGVLLAVGRVAGGRMGSTFNATFAAIVLALLPIVLYLLLTGGSSIVSWATLIVLGIAAAMAFGGWRLGRRSKLPLVRAISVGYIELFRGVPLYVLLLLSYLALGFFLPTWLPSWLEDPSLASRAIIALTIFTAAYVAEIVRGGLQSLPRGQTEAAEALGLSPVKTTALIVLPQALRNVIPGLVGQFISLFKDTTLVGAAMTLFDVGQVADVVTAQPEFRGQGLTAETYSFVMLLFWVGCITMSRESQRLERRLGVGMR